MSGPSPASIAAWGGPLLLFGCTAIPDPRLTLLLPDSPLYGEVEVVASGPFDWLELAVDGTRLQEGAGTQLAAPWDTTGASDGEHLVRASGWLGDSRLDAWEEVRILQAAADTEAPTVAFLTPRDGTTVEGESVEVVLGISDDSALDEVVVSLDQEVVASLPPEGPYALVLDALSPGPHIVAAAATDVAGHTTTASIHFEVAMP
jgi:hypothetical protein